MAASNGSELFSVEAIKEAERLTIEEGSSGRELMENAGEQVAQAILARYRACPTLVVCGGGNNGGDGFIVARKLKEHNWQVTVAVTTEAHGLKGEAAHARDQWLDEGGGVLPFESALLKKAELIVDAIIGVGLKKAPEGKSKEAIEAIAKATAPVVSVDVPSGVDADTGEVPGAAVKASLTVTFFRAKPGLFLHPGRAHAGELMLADIGITEMPKEKPVARLNVPPVWRSQMPEPALDGHKYQRGHLVVCGGPETCTGAARLAALSGARSGAGLVTVACDTLALPVYASSLLSIMTKAADNARDFGKLIGDERVTALVMGPGNGTSEVMRGKLEAALSSGKPCVIDADALTLLADNRDALLSKLHSKCVLTPHEGEFKKLFPRLSGGKLKRAKAAAEENKCVIVLKGADTVIAVPGEIPVINANAPRWLATAGSGDVLAGAIAGLMAQGMDPFAAALAGVWMHGRAGEMAGRGLIADDLPALLPATLAPTAAAA